MKSNSHFQRGSAVFTCECCGRRTRKTGVQYCSSRTCPQCFELAGMENIILDSCGTAAELAGERDRLIKAALKGGGDEARIRRSFSELFAAIATPKGP